MMVHASLTDHSDRVQKAMSIVIFIDFDGVLHPAGGPPGAILPFEWVDELAAMLEPFQGVQLVVHSSWQLNFPSDYIRDFLGPLGARFIGVVGPGSKSDAIDRYVRDHPEVDAAIVVDDQPEEFPSNFRFDVIACDPATGVRNRVVQELLVKWLSQQKGQEAPPSSSISRTGDSKTGEPPKTVKVEAVVSTIIDEFEHLQLDLANGNTLCVGERTRGVNWRDLRIGQRLPCEMEVGPLPRVLSAEVLEPRPAQE